jgi:hypothetical protein
MGPRASQWRPSSLQARAQSSHHHSSASERDLSLGVLKSIERIARIKLI